MSDEKKHRKKHRKAVDKVGKDVIGSTTPLRRRVVAGMEVASVGYGSRKATGSEIFGNIGKGSSAGEAKVFFAREMRKRCGEPQR